MARWTLAAGAGALALGVVAAAAAQDGPAAGASPFPHWAFPGARNLTLPGSPRQYSWVQMYDRAQAVDWFPDRHPPMPASVKGAAPVYACGFCHLPEGAGRPETPALAGLPAAYIMQQVRDFASGARRSPDPDYVPTRNMAATAAQAPPAGLAEAAAYYAGLKYVRRVKLVESADVPVHHADGFVYVFDKDGGREPLGQRIIEGPDDFERFEMRDPGMTFTAYVPVGSIARGDVLAKGDGAARPSCESCHGEGLKGGAIGPAIAGRTPTYLFRQLYGFQAGARTGPQAELMKPVVAGLPQSALVELSAYVASREP